MFEKNCPNPNNNSTCKKIQNYSLKSKLNYSIIRNIICKSCARYKKFWTEESKNKMRGDNNPSKRPEVRKKISDKKLENHYLRNKTYNEYYGKKKATKLIKKQREDYLERIEKLYGQLAPFYNPQGCEIINWFNMYYDFNFQHAENGGEICIDGYFPDGLDKTVIIEIDEKHHFDGDGNLKQKDIERQQYLESKGYELMRIRV